MHVVWHRGPRNAHLVEARLCVQFAEGGDDERLRRAFRLHVGPVGRHRLWVGQRTYLKLRVKLRKCLLQNALLKNRSTKKARHKS